MKTQRLTFLSLGVAALLPTVMSCTSDPNPFFTIEKVENGTAQISLNFEVAATRATDLSTADEKKITKVNVFVFNESGLLESDTIINIVSTASSIELNVTPGTKTIYAVSAKKINDLPIAEGTSIQDFENTVFPSTLNDLTLTSNGEINEFVMVGKSKTQQVYRTGKMGGIPASNIFNIEMVRLVAKTQVKLGSVNTEAFGFTKRGTSSFYVAQTCDMMRLKPNDNDVMSFESPNSGTYNYYTLSHAVKSIRISDGDFTAENCCYLSENIVKNPVSGNTSFVVLTIQLYPTNIYSYNKYSNSLTSTPNTNSNMMSFYAVGLLDRESGLADYAIDSTNKHVIVFNDKTNADDYVKSLNGGEASAMTVSQTDSPLKTIATKAGEDNTRNFETIMFNNCMVYYRINISDENGAFKVERNKFYKIMVNSIKGLGSSLEPLLRPTDPETDLSDIPTSAMVNAMFNVADWDAVDSNVDL